MGNHEIDFHEFCGVMKRMSDKQNSWNDVTRECFAVFDRVSDESDWKKTSPVKQIKINK